MGAGYDEKTYFYNSDKRTFTFYDFKNGEELLTDAFPEDSDIHILRIIKK